MKKYLLIALSLFLFSCEKENRWDCVKSYGDEIVEQRSAGQIDRVYIQDRVDFEYRYADDFAIEVRFGENIVEHIKTEVREGSLHIRNDATCNWVRDLSKRPLVTLYAPEIAYLENRSSGDIVFKDTLRTGKFTYEQWEGNGEIELAVVTDTVQIYMHVGYCSVKAGGRTHRAELYSGSNGKLRAGTLKSEITLSNNASIQDIELYASEYLYAAINGSGNILYRGNPSTVDPLINGSGQILPF